MKCKCVVKQTNKNIMYTSANNARIDCKQSQHLEAMFCAIYK